ncbi:PREDICTED: uncharacterized protein LOC101296933 [Fragaria vesca subsp. vesca]
MKLWVALVSRIVVVGFPPIVTSSIAVIGFPLLGTCLMADYFIERPIFREEEFRRSMGESTTLECMKKFCQQVVGIFGPQYLRAPTKADLQRLLARADQRGFPDMIGSIDCMHWEWKNCRTGWHGAYSGRKGRPTVILEAVASHDTWVWHAFFSVPGAQNDINVLDQSPVF